MAFEVDVKQLADGVASQIAGLNVTDAAAVRAAGVSITKLSALNPVKASRFIEQLREAVLHVSPQE